MSYRRAGVRLHVPGLTDHLLGRVADACYAATTPGITDAGIAAAGDEIQITGLVDAGSADEAVARLREFAERVLEKAGISGEPGDANGPGG